MSMEILRGDERLPLYQRLADTLRQEIVTGIRRPGDRLPSENIIAKDYGIAPGTARQALAQLVKQGILERFHGKGTFVRRPSFDQSLFRFFRFRGKSGDATVPESRILRRAVEPCPDYVSLQLQIKKGGDAICISRLRLLEDTPVLAEEIWLPLELFSDFLDVNESEIGPLLYPIYDAHCGHVIARAEEKLTAEPSSKEIARLLGVTAGEPLITLERLARGYDGTPLEWRRSRGRATQFTYQTEIF